MKLESTSKRLNKAGLEIVQGWKVRAKKAGTSISGICRDAEKELNASGVPIKEDTLRFHINMWRYQPPATLLLLHRFFEVSKNYHCLNTREAGIKHLEAEVEVMEFNLPVSAIQYYIAIEKALVKAEGV